MNPTMAAEMREQVLATMANAAEDDEWDVEPVMLLWFVDAAGELGFTHMPGFLLILERLQGSLRDVPRVAAMLVRKAAAEGVPVLDRDVAGELTFVAVMLCHEGWAFTPPKDEAQAAEMAEWVRTKSIADHPLGVETRNITAVGADGYYLSAVHVRGEAEAVVASSLDGQRGDHVHVDVMYGLRDLYAAITETT